MAKAKLQIKPEAMVKIARHLGHNGDMAKFKDFLASDPAKQHLMNRYYKKAENTYRLAKGGSIVKGYAPGGLTDAQIANLTTAEAEQLVTQLGGGNIKGSTGDYSNLDTFKGYSGWDNVEGGFDTWKKVAEKAGYGKEDKKSSDMNVTSGAGSFAYKHTDDDSTTNTNTTGTTANTSGTSTGSSGTTAQQNPIEQTMTNLAENPELKGDMKLTGTKVAYNENQKVGDSSGQLTGSDPKANLTKGTASEADKITEQDAELYTADKSSADIKKETDKLSAEQLDKKDIKTIDAEQQTKSSVSDLDAAQGDAILMDDLEKRKLEDGELVEAVADAKKAAKFTEEIEAATGDPSEKATMSYQVSKYMEEFENGKVPLWAAGAMKSVINQMASMGVSGSNATQAIMHAMLEKSIDLASVDAQTFARFDAMNLSNRQQRNMLAAQQRAVFMGQEFNQQFQSKVLNASKVSDIANRNFTAEQQIALENSRVANTMNLANLSNKQALIMGEAAALANLDIANLNNRQQAAVQNAQNFLAVDMANLSNKQQTSLFKSQASINGILSDTAATNAQKQFNAQSENQMQQFYDNLSSQVSMFNTAQSNAMSKFNAGQENAISQFNAQVENQRDQFNAQNQLIVDQSNAQWRRQIATLDTASTNRANELNASALLGISQSAYNQIWQQYGEAMERAWQSSENELQRMTSLAQTKMQVDGQAAIANADRNAGFWSNIGGFVFDWINPFD